jgi:hypothetical protein
MKMKKRMETRKEQNMEKKKKENLLFSSDIFVPGSFPSLVFPLFSPPSFPLPCHSFSFLFSPPQSCVIPMLFLTVLHSPTNSCVTFNELAIAHPPPPPQTHTHTHTHLV